MNGTDNTETVSKSFGYAVGLVSGVISIALAILSIMLVTKYDSSDPREVKIFIAVLSIIISFVMFFGVIAFRIFISQMTNQRELMSIRGWRLLAIIFLLIGVISTIYGHWVALLLPSAMALFCLCKDRRFIEKLRAIYLIP